MRLFTVCHNACAHCNYYLLTRPHGKAHPTLSQQPPAGEDRQPFRNDLGNAGRQRANVSHLAQIAAEATTGPLPIVTATRGPVKASELHGHRKPQASVAATLMEHRTRFAAFSVIGAAIFVMGIAIQAWLTGRLHMNANLSFLLQGIVSVQASFVANYYWTWRDQDVAFWPACGKFNVQKVTVSIANLLVYAGLVTSGMNYLLANVVTTAVFTVVNYVMSHVWVFTSKKGATAPLVHVPTQTTAARGFTTPVAALPTVSVIIPCRNNAATIRATVDSLLGQDYPSLHEVILVGSTGDSTWSSLVDVMDPRLVMLEQENTPGKRDPNVKRDKGLQKASGEVLALADSDIVMDPDWLRCAIPQLLAQGGGVVAGGMKRIHDTFWGRFVDRNVLAAKTPRVRQSYLVTAQNFGHHRTRPPITANAVFSRDVYESCPLDVTWAYGYEDYEWFWRVAKAGHNIWFAGDIHGAHHHRRRFRDLITEYRRSAEGCSHFIRRHPDSPLAAKRRLQAIGLPLVTATGIGAAGALVATGLAGPVIGLVALGALVLMSREMLSARRLEAAVYPYAGAALGVVFTWTLATNLTRREVARAAAPTWEDASEEADQRERGIHLTARTLTWPLGLILALQAACSLTLVWSNSAFADEANYLWQGHLEWSHWLHGTKIPIFHDSGAALIYPPIGALADSIGGLAGARILSLCFMLISTALLYFTARHLFGTGAAVCGAVLWAVSEPVLRLTFATYDPLACMFVALSAWLIVQSSVRRHRGELVAAAAVCLALGSVIAVAFAIMIPVVVLFGFLVLNSTVGNRMAWWCSAWLGGGAVIVMVGLLTYMHMWADAIGSTVGRRKANLDQGVVSIIRAAWSWDGLLAALALAAIVIALAAERTWTRRMLVAFLAASGTVVPVYQAHIGTGWSLDKHMTGCTWFMAIAAGYALAKARPASWTPAVTGAAFCGLLVYPLATGIWYSRSAYQMWPNETNLVTAIRPLAARASGPILASNDTVLEYYLPQGAEWGRWAAATGKPPVILTTNRAGLIVLQLNGDLQSPALAKSLVPVPSDSLSEQALKLSATNGGLYSTVRYIEHDRDYRLARVVPYQTSDSSASVGVFAVWVRK